MTGPQLGDVLMNKVPVLVPVLVQVPVSVPTRDTKM